MRGGSVTDLRANIFDVYAPQAPTVVETKDSCELEESEDPSSGGGSRSTTITERAPSRFSVDQEVFARMEMFGSWFDAKVTCVNDDGTYGVLFLPDVNHPW